MTTRQGSLNLLELPVDILALIIRPLVVAQETITLCPCAFHSASLTLPGGICSLLLVHPSLHAIACPLLYTANAFELDLTSKHGNAVRKGLDDAAAAAAQTDRMSVLDVGDSRYAALQRHDMGALLLFAEPSARRRMRSLRVKLDRLRGWIGVSVVPVLADMVLHGNLSELTIVVSESVGGGHSQQRDATAVMQRQQISGGGGGGGGDASILSRPPVAGLLRLLADPYLRVARLLVTPGHGQVWCLFHEPRTSCGVTTAPSSGAAEARELRARSHSGLIEIDWRAIVKEVLDPAGTELAVGWTADAAARGRV